MAGDEDGSGKWNFGGHGKLLLRRFEPLQVVKRCSVYSAKC